MISCAVVAGMGSLRSRRGLVGAKNLQRIQAQTPSADLRLSNIRSYPDRTLRADQHRSSPRLSRRNHRTPWSPRGSPGKRVIPIPVH
ncbi:hypothetical protein MTP99_001901 [Tenebrio molitor]|nr:hypothetical protein MTP99_001901 [Tenebrio molitor]